MQKKTNRIKSILLTLLFAFLITANNVFSQEPADKINAAKELRHFWKQNELLIGIGSALFFTLVVYAFWKKKKRSFENIDSIS